MLRFRLKSLLIAFLFIIPLVLTGCSEDEAEAPPTDTTPPTITGHFPADGASDVTRSGPYWVAFSEAMDEESVDLSLSSYHVYNTAWNGDTIFMTPTSLLDGGTEYTITVYGTCEDLHGNELGNDYPFSFTTTTEADNTPPSVIHTDPEHNATGVSPSKWIEITFSEPMTPVWDWDTQNIIDIDPEPDDGEFEWEATTLVIYHTPFPTDSLIVVTVNTTATDLAGNPLSAPYTFSFRTMVDNVRPYLESASPSNGATGIPTSLSQIVLNFSEPMFPIFEMSLEHVDARINKVVRQEPDWNEDYSSMTVPISEYLLPGCTYWVEFHDATDAAGNPIDPNPTTYEFTTAGAVSHFPVSEGARWTYVDEWSDVKIYRIDNYSPSTGNFDQVRTDEYGTINDVHHLRVTTNLIQHRGISEYDGGILDYTWMWDEPLPYIKLPLENYLGDTWNFSSVATGTEYDVHISGSVEIEGSKVNLVNEFLYGTFKDCFVHHLSVDMYMIAGSDTVDEGHFHNIMYLSPGVGIVRFIDEEVGEVHSDTLTIVDWDL